MITSEAKLKKKVQLIVASCLSLFFILCTVLIFQFAIRMNQDAQIRLLTDENNALVRQIDRARLDTTYFNSEQFRIDFALRFLNRGKSTDRIFM